MRQKQLKSLIRTQDMVITFNLLLITYSSKILLKKMFSTLLVKKLLMILWKAIMELFLHMDKQEVVRLLLCMVKIFLMSN